MRDKGLHVRVRCSLDLHPEDTNKFDDHISDAGVRELGFGEFEFKVAKASHGALSGAQTRSCPFQVAKVLMM